MGGVGGKASLSVVRLTDRLQRAASEDIGHDRDDPEDREVGHEERAADPLDRKAVRLAGLVRVVDLGRDVERGLQHDRQRDEEHGAEREQDHDEHEQIAPREATARFLEHQVRAGSARIRYPAPRTVSISPSRRPSSILRRRLRMYTSTMFEPTVESAFHTASIRRSWAKTWPGWRASTSSSANSRVVRRTGTPARVTPMVAGSSSRSPTRTIGGRSDAPRRSSARTRARSSAAANGFGR